MKQRLNLQDLEKHQVVTLEHLVYEADDNEMLLSCKIVNNGKSYTTHYLLDFIELNQIISHYLKIGIDLYDALTEKLLYSKEHYREFCFKKHIGDKATLYNPNIAA